jgi:hypothetical protein
VHNAHPLLALKISRKKLVRVYNAHGLLKKIVVGNVRIKYQSYIFFSPLSMFRLLGEFKNHLSYIIFYYNVLILVHVYVYYHFFTLYPLRVPYGTLYTTTRLENKMAHTPL